MILAFRILYLSVSSYEAYNFENIFFKHESVLNRDQDPLAVLYAYRVVLPRGICLTINSLITWWLFPLFPDDDDGIRPKNGLHYDPLLLLLLSSSHLVFYAFSQMSTNVPINRMTVMPMPPVTIPLVPIDAPAIPGTKETEQAAILVSLTNTEIRVTSVCYDARISPSLSFCIVIWSFKFWKYIFLTWVGPESRPRSPRCSLRIPCGAAKGNLFDNQQLDNLVIISFIPIILMFGSAVRRS